MTVADAPIVYLVVRPSPDCSPRMVEIMGACWSLADADALREYIFEATGHCTKVQRLRPDAPKT